MLRKRKFPVYKQLSTSDCGPTCIRAIAKYYGKDLDMVSLKDLFYVRNSGVSVSDIIAMAKYLKFDAEAVKLGYSAFVKYFNEPVILFWNDNHFVICYDIIKHRSKVSFKISDPIGQKYVLDEAHFKKYWYVNGERDKGICVKITPTPAFNEGSLNGLNNNKLLGSSIVRLFRSYFAPIIIIFIGMLVSIAVTFALPFLTKSIVDVGINNGNTAFVCVIAIFQTVLYGTQYLGEYFRNLMVVYVNNRLSIALVSDFLYKLLSLPIRFFDSRNIGEILQRINDNERIRSFLTTSSVSFVFSSLNFIIFSVVLVGFNVITFLIYFVGNILYTIWTISFLRYRRKLDMIRFANEANSENSIIQSVNGIIDLKVNGWSDAKRWEWEDIQVDLYKLRVKGLHLAQVQQFGGLFFIQMTTILISLITALDVINGTMTLGMMLAISYILGQLSIPVNQFIAFIQSFQDAKISIERLNEINGAYNNIKNNNKSLVKLSSPLGDIILDNVEFKYSISGPCVLKDISLSIPGGKVTAIVGASGSGKTTLAKLILKFYDPTSGKIQLGGHNLSNIDPRYLWDHCGIVMQDGYIFSDTILHNITLTDKDFNEQNLAQALRIANLNEVISQLPNGINTKIGSNGLSLSKGQCQRILIARAIYRQPSIILFDEATNSLDANNEKIITEGMQHFFCNRTVIIIAHRLSTIMKADNIIVLNSGRVSEQGTHENLIAQQGEYYNLFMNQFKIL